jgi:hypothetical protein
MLVATRILIFDCFDSLIHFCTMSFVRVCVCVCVDAAKPNMCNVANCAVCDAFSKSSCSLLCHVFEFSYPRDALARLPCLKENPWVLQTVLVVIMFSFPRAPCTRLTSHAPSNVHERSEQQVRNARRRMRCRVAFVVRMC